MGGPAVGRLASVVGRIVGLRAWAFADGEGILLAVFRFRI